jgi:hypothetical protein
LRLNCSNFQARQYFFKRDGKWMGKLMNFHRKTIEKRDNIEEKKRNEQSEDLRILSAQVSGMDDST